MLNREQLRSKGLNMARRFRLVTLIDGSQVRIQSLNRAEQREWRNAVKRKDGTPDPKKLEYSNDILLAMCVVDEEGKQVFTLGDALSGMFDYWDTQDTTVLLDATVDHCGLVADAKEIEARVKNSEATPGNDSSGVAATDTE